MVESTEIFSEGKEDYNNCVGRPKHSRTNNKCIAVIVVNLLTQEIGMYIMYMNNRNKVNVANQKRFS